MAIFEALGINSSVFFQFLIFVITIVFLSQVTFSAYAEALEKRDQKTVGSAGVASEIQKSALELNQQYESRAREVNSEIKTIYASYREQAAKEYESLMSKAREESLKTLESARARVSVEINEAARKLKEETPALSQAITQKLLSKEKVHS